MNNPRALCNGKYGIDLPAPKNQQKQRNAIQQKVQQNAMPFYKVITLLLYKGITQAVMTPTPQLTNFI